MTQKTRSVCVFEAAVRKCAWTGSLHSEDKDHSELRPFDKNPAMGQLCETIHRDPPGRALHGSLDAGDIQRLVCSIRSNQHQRRLYAGQS